MCMQLCDGHPFMKLHLCMHTCELSVFKVVVFSIVQKVLRCTAFKLGVVIITCTKDRIDPKFAKVQSIYI